MNKSERDGIIQRCKYYREYTCGRLIPQKIRV